VTSVRRALEREVVEASLVPGLDRNVVLGALAAMRSEALLPLRKPDVDRPSHDTGTRGPG
jgi:hypothetical protein